MPEPSRSLTPQEIRNQRPEIVANFLDQAQGVDQGHLRFGLALALTKIAQLENRVAELEKRR
jgi:hypothetical protein